MDEILEVLPGFSHHQPIDRLVREVKRGVPPHERLHRRDRFEPEKTIRIVERRNQEVHRLLARDLTDCGRHVPPHPDVFIGVGHHAAQRRQDRLTVADECIAGAALEPPMPEE